jgi:hypothetical protein
LRDGVKELVVVRRELVRVALNIFKGWRAQVRGSRICPTTKRQFNSRDAVSEDGRRLGADAELQAGWLAGWPACMRQANAMVLDMANAERSSAHARLRPRLAAWSKKYCFIESSMGVTYVFC